MTTFADQQIVPREPAILPELRAADQGVAEALTAVLAGNTRRVYAGSFSFQGLAKPRMAKSLFTIFSAA